MVRMKRCCSYKGEVGKAAPNIMNRDFVAEKPNQKWKTDITEFYLFDEKLYLSPILDMYNGEIVCYTLNKRPVLQQVLDMVDMAFQKLPDTVNLVFHSNQGW